MQADFIVFRLLSSKELDGKRRKYCDRLQGFSRRAGDTRTQCKASLEKTQGRVMKAHKLFTMGGRKTVQGKDQQKIIVV